jgi:hypothetical protein
VGIAVVDIFGVRIKVGIAVVDIVGTFLSGLLFFGVRIAPVGINSQVRICVVEIKFKFKSL